MEVTKKLNCNSLSKLGYVGNGTGVYAKSRITSESTLTNKCITSLKRLLVDTPHFIRKMSGGHYQRAGLPDLYIQLKGRALWIEMKLPGGDTTATQRQTMINLYEAGAYVATCESIEEVIATVGQMLLIESAKRGEY